MIIKKIFAPVFFVSLLATACQEPVKRTNTTESATNQKSISIPMHGTKNNSSSSSNQSFKQQQDQLNKTNQKDSLTTKQVP
ncbi:hypothetical protein [Myroides sp. LJL119]